MVIELFQKFNFRKDLCFFFGARSIGNNKVKLGKELSLADLALI